MRLSVFRKNQKVGLLDIQANEPFYGFAYDSEYLSSQAAMPLSVSLPLAEARYPCERVQPYFEGLLPEGEARDTISRRLGLPRTSSVKLLQALGRDCAGDVTIIDESEIEHSDYSGYLPLGGGIAGIAKNPREQIPQLQENMRLSLAGGQEKIALYHKYGETIKKGWYIPQFGAPSTHIIKPGLLENYYPHITLNEFLCLRAATACDIQTANVDILFPETPILIIGRYDRVMSEKEVNGFREVTRIHQEDFCQACCVKSDFKYEHDGGLGYKKIREMLARYSKNPIEDILMLVKWGIFNYLIGNCDAHAKNLSLLHNADGTISLAPAYDLISTAVYDGSFGSKLTRSMGMKIGMHINIDKISAEGFKIFARDVSIRFGQVTAIGSEIISKLPDAFESASAAAEKSGFINAGEISERILRNAQHRVAILT
ncbi:MAG: type II toxin-antitoxin system HipA family toxin [Oscillospiraceae bacterium]|nr:type II toxin-antitoxin system HipA family toxin [Oscillospiraceae bacterium]